MLLILYLIVAFSSFTLGDKTNSTRAEKALSVFSIVKFPNSACKSSTSGRNGTCYTASECTANSGTASGTCASSFGVCCIFEKSCGGGPLSQNNTYFTSSARTAGASCSLEICRCSTDVCQLRLDFETFAMANPVTSTAITVGPSTQGEGSANRIGNCDVDQFTVTVPGGRSPPVICGTNSGEHMYVPASEQCNILTGLFGSSSTSTTEAFTIKITQIECGSRTKAPDGCLQYFTSDTGTISTYNYNAKAGAHLANQDYTMCIRPGRTFCSICYYMAAIHDFKLGVPNGIAAIGVKGFDTNCGRPGITAFAKGGSFDYVMIPDGQCDSPDPTGAVYGTLETNDRYCGTSFLCLKVNDLTPDDSARKNTVCSMNKPFRISVHTDGVEYADAAIAEGGVAANTRGFSLGYFQKTACLTRPDV